MRVFVLAAACFTVASAAWAEPKEFPVRAVTIEKDIVVTVAPLAAWNAFTGDVSPWWDHHFSEKPYKLVIDRKPGGGFWEIFDHAGHGVKHAEVIVADPGKILRMRGPLGFSGKAVDLVQTLEFSADPKGTKVHFTLNALGQLDDEGIAALDRVWEHFLERYQSYVDGMHAK